MERPGLVYQGEEVPPAWSFRDPGGSVVAREKRIFRIINAAGRAEFKAFLASPTGMRWIGSGKVVATRTLAEDEKTDLLEDPGVARLYAGLCGEAVLEHECIPFPSFPYEWAPEMLHAAADRKSVV